MNKLLLTALSFVAGVYFGGLVLGSPEATADQTGVIVMPASIPNVNKIQFNGLNSTISGPVQQLDGFACDRCIINVKSFTYGGGAVNVRNCKIPTGATIELQGAALNTFSWLKDLGYLNERATTPILEIKPGPFTFKALNGVKPETGQPNP